MNPLLVEQLVNGFFMLVEGGLVERPAVIARLTGVPVEEYPKILDALYAESVVARDAAIKDAPE